MRCLKRPVLREVKVVGLHVGKRSKLNVETSKVGCGNLRGEKAGRLAKVQEIALRTQDTFFFIQGLRQHVHMAVLVSTVRVVLPKLDPAGRAGRCQ